MSIFKLDMQIEEFPYLRTLQDAVLEFTRNEYSDIDKFLGWWDEKGNKISIQLSDKQDAVTIMTIHKSKGLAFKVVIIPFCDWELDHNAFIAPIIWCKTENEPFNKFNFLPVKYKKELAQTVFQQDYFDEKLYAQMDALNMLYVAFTRPEEELIVFAPTDESEKVSQVADLLYQTVQKSNENFTENNKKYISLLNFFDKNNVILSVDDGYNEIDKDKFLRESSDNAFPLNEYPNFDWRQKISLVSHADDFFIKSIQFIEDKVNYGTLMHKILSRIETSADIEEVIEEMRSTGIVDFEEAKNLKTKITKIISRPTVIDWFSNKYKIKKESGILTSKGEIRIPDRILFSESEVIVIDFKFGEIRIEYEDQLLEYMQIVSEIEPTKKVKGFIYYADKAKPVEIKGQMKLF
jgi:ATP-dependent exoDNAse (exonuclease V) beta subunit